MGNQGYRVKVTDPSTAISHRFFMDYLNLYAKNKEEMSRHKMPIRNKQMQMRYAAHCERKVQFSNATKVNEKEQFKYLEDEEL